MSGSSLAMRTFLSRTIILPNVYWLGTSFMWNSVNILILPAVLLKVVDPARKNTTLGLLTLLGLLVAMIVQPLSGAWSDRWRSSWGRRRPFMIAGVAGDYLFLGVLALAGGIPGLAIGYLGLQFTSNLAHGPAQGLLPDLVPRERLGAASGMRNLMDMGGLIAASLVTSRLLAASQGNPNIAYLLIGGTLGLAASVTILGSKEAGPTTAGRPAELPHPTVRGSLLALSPSYRRLLLARFLFLLGLFGIQGFGQYYVRDVLAARDPFRLTGDLAAALTLMAVLFALLGGWLGDRAGDRRVQVLAAALGAPGSLLLLTARTTPLVLSYAGIVGAAFGLFLTANWAQANRLAPRGDAGRVLGLANLATAGAAVASRILGPMIDLANQARPGEFIGYSLLFLLAAGGMLLSAVIIQRTPGTEPMEGDPRR